MKYLITFLVLFIFLGNISAQSIEFEKIYGTQPSSGYSGCQTFDGGYVVAGSTYLTNDTGYFYLVKTDSVGDTLWTNHYKSYQNESTCERVRQTKDSGFIMIGYATPAGTNYDDFIVVVKTNSKGGMQWMSDTIPASDATGSDIQQTKDGGYILIGTTSSVSTGYVYLEKMNSGGTREWIRNFNFGIGSGGYAVKQTMDGGFILSCGTATGNTLAPYPITLAKVDSAGNEKWYNNIITDSMGIYQNEPDVIQLPDSGYLITTTMERDAGATPPHICMIRTNSKGDTIYTRNINNENAFYGEPTMDGGFIIAASDAGYDEAQLFKLDSACHIMWKQNYPYLPTTIGYEVHQTKDRGYIIAGAAQSGPKEYSMLIKTDSLGNTTGPTSIINYNRNSLVDEYPNPTNGIINFNLSFTAHKSLKISVYNILGENVYSNSFPGYNSHITINFKDQPAGVYFYHITSDRNELIATGKFVVE
jgi:hypothetical protein